MYVYFSIIRIIHSWILLGNKFSRSKSGLRLILYANRGRRLWRILVTLLAIFSGLTFLASTPFTMRLNLSALQV